MFVGHYAPALAETRWFPEVPPWQLFVAVQAVDVLFFALVPLGVEHLTIDPTREGSLALGLDFMPYSHSLLAAVGWALLPVLLLRSRAGLALGLAIASHWFLDLPMHLGDLPLAAGDGARVGLGLWAHPVAAWAFELGVLGLGAALAGRRWYALAALLAVVQTLQTFVVPLPTSTLAVAAMSQASYVAVAAAAAWIGRPSTGAARPPG